MELSAEQNRQRIDRLRASLEEAKKTALGLSKTIQNKLAFSDGQPGMGGIVGGLAAQYDEALTKYKVYLQELYEATS